MAKAKNFEFEEGDHAHLDKIASVYKDALLTVCCDGGMSYEDAARHLGTATGTVKSRVNRAKAGIVALRLKAEKAV